MLIDRLSFNRAYLGHGVGLRQKHFARWLSEKPAVDWVEVISENFFARGGRPLAVLEKVRADLPVVMHGVSLSIGSTDPLNAGYLADLKQLAARFQPAWISDHLCWGSHGSRYGHDLWPLPYTEEALNHVVDRVRAVQDILRRQIVRDVDERRVGANSQRDAFHGAGVMVARAEIGKQSNDRPGHAPMVLRIAD